MFSQPGVDALCSATYLEDYLDGLESLPDQIQRHVSEVRRLDADYFDAMKKMKQLKNVLVRYGVRCMEKKTTESLSNDQVNGEVVEDIPADQRRQKRAIVLKHLKYLLLRSQSIADCKLAELACINELVEAKTRQLEHDSKNMELDVNENNGASLKLAGSSHSTESSSSQERSVRSIMRGFFQGEKDRLLDLSLQTSADDNIQTPRSEKHPSTVSVASVSAPALITIASEAESEAASPSASSSVTATMDASSTSRQANKRPRRQKQFPDFVRTEFDTSTSSLPTASGTNGINAMSPSAVASASSTSVAPNTRSSKERSSSSGSLAQSNKRKKKRQKPESTSSAGGGGGSSGSTGKIKFTLPVDPDEPTYCLCEQVSYGEMIGCDNSDCDIEWFHFNCVGLTSKPKGKWFCPNCRGDRPNIMKQQSAKNG